MMRPHLTVHAANVKVSSAMCDMLNNINYLERFYIIFRDFANEWVDTTARLNN